MHVRWASIGSEDWLDDLACPALCEQDNKMLGRDINAGNGCSVKCLVVLLISSWNSALVVADFAASAPLCNCCTFKTSCCEDAASPDHMFC